MVHSTINSDADFACSALPQVVERSFAGVPNPTVSAIALQRKQAELLRKLFVE